VLLTWTVRPYTSTTKIATVNSKRYINDYKCIKCIVRDKVVADGPVVYTGRSARTLKMNFTEPDTFGFFWFSMGDQSALEGQTV
jgi:hypothetical protein